MAYKTRNGRNKKAIYGLEEKNHEKEKRMKPFFDYHYSYGLKDIHLCYLNKIKGSAFGSVFIGKQMVKEYFS